MKQVLSTRQFNQNRKRQLISVKLKQNFIVGFSLLSFTAPAFAYIDPGSGSLLLQILIAGLIGFFFRFRAYIQSLLIRVKQWFRH